MGVSDDIPIGSTTGEVLTASVPASPIKALYPSTQVKAPFKLNIKNIEKIKFESLVQDFAGFTSARGYSNWKADLIDQGYTSSQIRDIVYEGSLLRGDNLWKGDWKKYYEEISGTSYPGKPSHAHHLVEKGGMSEAAIENRLILKEVGINPLLSRENLTWAPNITGQHGSIPQGQLLNKLLPVRYDRDGVIGVLNEWAEIARNRK